MPDEKGNGLAGLVVIKAICCGTLVLAVTGVLGGFGAWLLDDGLVWFILIVAAAAALARRGMAAAIGRLGKYVHRASGAVLFIAGLYVVYYWGVPLFAPGMAGEDSVIQYGDSLAGDLSRWLGGSIGRNTAYALSALLAVTAVWALVRRLVLVFRVDTRPSRLPGQDPTVEA